MSKQHNNFYANYTDAAVGYIIGNQLNKGINNSSVMTQCIPWRSWTPVVDGYPAGNVSSNTSLFSIVGEICTLSLQFSFLPSVGGDEPSANVVLPVNARLSSIVGLKYNSNISYTTSADPTTLVVCGAEIIPNTGTETFVRIYTLDGSDMFITSVPATTTIISGTIKYQVSNI